MKFRRNFGLIFALILCRVAYQPVDWFTKKIWCNIPLSDLIE